ncbi:NUDIX hydrolase [Lichenicoccus sp.]|uniref:NUDIX hydrolase n=1 Tax=Lichenicoccus sp. TaxID=2781899 RepID=UPI003D14B0EA
MAPDRTGDQQTSLHAELIAVLVAVHEGTPRVLTLGEGAALPSGPLEPAHRSLQSGLRSWVEHQTHHPLGYVEQLYTFGDRDRAEGPMRAISISYLALTRIDDGDAGWRGWYGYFPWEDQRGEAGVQAARALGARVLAWAAASAPELRETRRQRGGIGFGLQGSSWDEELVLQRYELLYEAGLVEEAAGHDPAPSGRPMLRDHRRILATGIARLRARIKYRPVVFELMPPTFTLLQLQLVFEALAGRRLHKQNFRRLIEQQNLVEETGALGDRAVGRPAKLFRFRREVLQARHVAGSKLPMTRPS